MAIAPAQLRQIFGEALWSALAHLFMRGALVVAFMLFSHSLSVEDFAVLNEFNLSISYLSAMILFGLGPIIVRHFSSDKNRLDGRSLGAIAFYFFVAVFSSVIISYFFAPKAMNNVGSGLFTLLLGILVIGAFPNSTLNGFRRYQQTAVAAGAASLAFLLVAALSKSLLLGIIAIVAGYSVKVIIESVFCFSSISSEKFYLSLPDKQSLLSVGSSLLKIGSAAILATGGLFAMTKVLRGDISGAAFSQFALGMQWYAIGAFAAANVTRVMLPRQVALAAQSGRNSSGQRALLFQGLLIGTGGAGALAGVLLLAQPVVGMLYGAAASGVEETIPLFLLAALTAVPVNMVGNVAVAHHREGTWFVASLFGVVAMLGSLFLVSSDGPLRGALAIIVCNLLQTAICVAILIKEKLL